MYIIYVYIYRYTHHVLMYKKETGRLKFIEINLVQIWHFNCVTVFTNQIWQFKELDPMTNITCVLRNNFWVFCSSLVDPIRFNATFALSPFLFRKTGPFFPLFSSPLNWVRKWEFHFHFLLWMNPQLCLLLISSYFSVLHWCHHYETYHFCCQGNSLISN